MQWDNVVGVGQGASVRRAIETLETLSTAPVSASPVDPALRAIDVEWEADDRILWTFMNGQEPPHFTPNLLEDLVSLRYAVRRAVLDPTLGEAPLRYFVFGSRTPGIFNLGGDLSFFSKRIRDRDRESLRRYAYSCVEAVHLNLGTGLPLISIALVQGDALGGGFEAALSFDVIVAERSAKFGLPEILFNLFPGMGAYSLLSRRLDPIQAERMILSGRLYSAEELHAIGLVDVLAEDGQGPEAVRRTIAENRRSYAARRALHTIRKQSKPLGLDELRSITDVWVDTALQLTDQDLRRMDQLTAAQRRRRRSVPVS